MQTKNIEKLEELKDYPWEYKDKKFILNSVNGGAILIHKDFIGIDGKLRNFPLMTINHKNLTELEFYGLKVILNEKPKITREEWEFLEAFEDCRIYIARNKREAVDLRLFKKRPSQSCVGEVWFEGPNIDLTEDDYGIVLNSKLFPFITWESGKAWSKTELMELEVVE